MFDKAQIQILEEIHKGRTISAIATDLGLTQSAISQSIRNLESKLAVPLFEKQGKQIVLTEVAQDLLKVGLDYKKNFNLVLQKNHSHSAHISGEIKIGTLAGMGKSWVFPRVIEWLKKYPLMQGVLHTDSPSEICHMFKEHLLDCIIVPRSVAPSWAHVETIVPENLVMIYSKQSEAISESVKSKNFENIPWVFFEKNDPNVISWLQHQKERKPRTIKPKIIVNGYSNLISAVEEGLGAAVIPSHILDKSRQDSELVISDQNEIKGEDIVFVYHQQSAQSHALSQILEILKN